VGVSVRKIGLASAQIHGSRRNLAQIRHQVADTDVADLVGRGVDGNGEYISLGASAPYGA